MVIRLQKQQIYRIARFIENEIPGEPSDTAENTADTAIRLLLKYRRALEEIVIERACRNPRKGPFSKYEQIAWDALYGNSEPH